MRDIAFIAIPAFPIAVERVVSGRLRGRPVVLTQSANPRSRCLAVSTEARVCGIRRGMTLGDVRRRCRDVQLMHPNPDLYHRAAQAVWKLTSEYTPVAEPSGPGRNYLDLTGTGRLFGGADAVAAVIRRRLASELRLPSEAGTAVNKLVSRVAALDSSPEGLLAITRGCEEPFLAPHQVGVLPAADREVRQVLLELNIRKVEQIRDADTEHLLAAVGAAAFGLKRQSRGIDPTPVAPPISRSAITLTEVLTEDTNDPIQVSALLSRMVVEGVFQMHTRNISAENLTLHVVYSDGRTAVGRIRLRSHSDEAALWMDKTAELQRRVIIRRTRLRRIELVWDRLIQSHKQLELLSASSSQTDSYGNDLQRLCESKTARYNRAMAALETVRRKYGDAAITLGTAA